MGSYHVLTIPQTSEACLWSFQRAREAALLCRALASLRCGQTGHSASKHLPYTKEKVALLWYNLPLGIIYYTSKTFITYELRITYVSGSL